MAKSYLNWLFFLTILNGLGVASLSDVSVSIVFRNDRQHLKNLMPFLAIFCSMLAAK